MLHDVLLRYLEEVENAIRTLHEAYVEFYEENELIFRYDNTPHFPDLETFPNHKHQQTGVGASEAPKILKVIGEAAAISNRYP